MNDGTTWLATGVVSVGLLIGIGGAFSAEASAVGEDGVAGTPQAAGEGLGFGAYDHLVGKSYILPDGREAVWRRSASGHEVIREMFDSAGDLEWIAVIARLDDSGKLGYIMNVRGLAGSTGTKWGQVQADGSVVWTNENQYGTRDSVRGSDLIAEVFDPHGKLLATHQLPFVTNAQAEPGSAARDAMAIKLLEDLPGFVSSSIASIEASARTAEERRKMGESARRFNRAMESVGGALSAASDAAPGGYAEAQADLDATVANINAAAALDRQQQAQAEQQAQARAAEEKRQQLAENARWVAEKERAAAEYRSGQVEAAAAREAQLLQQQQVSEQRRAASEVQRVNAEQAATQERQRAQATALAERAQVVARPAAVEQATASAAPTAPSTQSKSDSIHMHVFFINVGGKTVAFEGPRAMTIVEGKAMKARLAGEAPGKYGAGANVDARWRGAGHCAFVYQLPGKASYQMGSGNSLSEAIESKDGQVNNWNAVVHHDVVCPTNH